MRHVVFCLSALLTLGIAGVSVAGPPKSTILHCGCTEAADAMVYVEISISPRSKGHDQHVFASVESCFDGVDTYIDLVRTGDDCHLDGPPVGALDACGDMQMAGAVCGEPRID